ncbi:hypothetical protein Tco_1199223, partial [Tanacetum coccineum]
VPSLLKGKVIVLSLLFSDSDWAKCPITRRYVSRYCVFINGNLVSWKSIRQATLSKSSAEAEYRSMASTTCEIMWIVKILGEFGIENVVPAELFCDKKLAIQIVANPVMHEKTKHFDIDVHLVREKVVSGLIKTVKVDTNCQVADILTKALGTFQHTFLVKKVEVTKHVCSIRMRRGVENIVFLFRNLMNLQGSLWNFSIKRTLYFSSICSISDLSKAKVKRLIDGAIKAGIQI